MEMVGKVIARIIERLYSFALVAGAVGLFVGIGISVGLLLALETGLPQWLLLHLGPYLKPGVNGRDMEFLVISTGGVFGFGMGCRAAGWS